APELDRELLRQRSSTPTIVATNACSLDAWSRPHPPARARLRELRLGIQSEPKPRSNEQQTAQNYRRNATGCRISTHDKSLRPGPRGQLPGRNGIGLSVAK